MWIFVVLFGYLFLVHFVSRLTVPYLGFKKSPLEKNIPEWLKTGVKKIDEESLSNKEYLKNAYEFVTSRYYCSRVESITKAYYLFHPPFYHKEGHLPCTLMNQILRTILVYSGRFMDSDIKIKTVPFNFIVHQYLQVKIGNKWVNVDPGGRSLGAKYGERAMLLG